MAITSAIPNSYKEEILEGTHEAADTYKLALFTNAATLGASTTAYSTTNEVVGTGYTAGGVTLAGFSAALDGSTAILDFSDASWANSTITARGCLIYNSSKSDAAVLVLDFGQDYTSTNGTFAIAFPAATAAAGLLRIA